MCVGHHLDGSDHKRKAYRWFLLLHKCGSQRIYNGHSQDIYHIGRSQDDGSCEGTRNTSRVGWVVSSSDWTGASNRLRRKDFEATVHWVNGRMSQGPGNRRGKGTAAGLVKFGRVAGHMVVTMSQTALMRRDGVIR